MLVALALYASTAHAGIPPDSAERRASVRMQTSLTEDQRALATTPSNLLRQSEVEAQLIVYDRAVKDGRGPPGPGGRAVQDRLVARASSGSSRTACGLESPPRRGTEPSSWTGCRR